MTSFFAGPHRARTTARVLGLCVIVAMAAGGCSFSAGTATDPTIVTVDAAGITGERAGKAMSFAAAASPASRGGTVAVLTEVDNGVGAGAHSVAVSHDAGTTWASAHVDGAATTPDSLESLASSPQGWIAVGRAAAGPKDRLVVYTSQDASSFSRAGDGAAVPEGAQYHLAGTTSGWTIVFRKDKDPWRVATSTDGVAWEVHEGGLIGLETGQELYLSSLTASDSELFMVGQHQSPSSTGGTSIAPAVYRSKDGGRQWRQEPKPPTSRLRTFNDGLRAATWTPEGFAAMGWAWMSTGDRAPSATLVVPDGPEGFTATVEKGLRDGTSHYAGNDELDYSEGAYLAQGSHGESPSIRTSLRVGTPGTWTDVQLPTAEEHSHRFDTGNVAVPGGFLSFQKQQATLNGRTEVFFIDSRGTATLRSTLSGVAAPATRIVSFASHDGTLEALGFTGTQAVLFRRGEGGGFGSPIALPADEPITFWLLRRADTGYVLAGRQQRANHSHALAWTSTDGVNWVPGSEAVLSGDPEDRSSISDALVHAGRYFAVGWAQDSQATSGSIAVTSGDGSWRQLSPEAFKGSATRTVGVSQIVAAADGGLVAAGTSTEDVRTELRLWRSADGNSFTEIPPPAGSEGAERTPSALARVGDTLVLAVTEETPEQKRRVMVYESTDNGATWAPAVQDPLEADMPVDTDLAVDGSDAVLVATVGTSTSSHATALRRQKDGSWRAMPLESRTLESDRTYIVDAALSGGRLMLSAEVGTPTERRPVTVEVGLPGHG